ncbi:hypothetical protein ACIQUP_00010 [Streptomyces nigra]
MKRGGALPGRPPDQVTGRTQPGDGPGVPHRSYVVAVMRGLVGGRYGAR